MMFTVILVVVVLVILPRDKKKDSIPPTPFVPGQINRFGKEAEVDTFSSIDPFVVVSSSANVTESGDVISINRENGTLVKISKNNTKVLYPSPVFSFSFADPFVSLVEFENRNKIVVINIASNDSFTLETKETNNTISVSINADAQKIFFLSGFNARTGVSTLYTSSLNGFSPVALIDTAATKVEALSSSSVLLIEEGEASGLGKVHIYDTKNKRLSSAFSADKYSVSPGGLQLLLQTNGGFQLLNVASLSLSQTALPDGTRTVWESEEVVVNIKNTSRDSIEITKVKLLTGEILSRKIAQTRQIVNVIGITENELIASNIDGEIIKISLTP